uniref:protein AF-10 isoform X2 n=1 Tax=Myxine glutinosa TaxID=7769 RepID=UPI00358EEE0F
MDRNFCGRPPWTAVLLRASTTRGWTYGSTWHLCHTACYGIVHVPTGPWFCRKCESQERAARVRCELCPHKDGALKRTDNGGWAHVVCALYIPEVQFANVSTMEPIVLQYVPHERYNKTCYICEEQGRESKAATGACMTCNKHGCRQAFHVTCAQMAGLLCEEEGSVADNVQYCGYCKYHFNKLLATRCIARRVRSEIGDKGPRKEKETRLPRACAPGQCAQKNKDKQKHKQKKGVESRPLLPSLTVTTEKTYTSSGAFLGGSLKRLEETASRFTHANFKEVQLHGARPSGDGGDGKDPEAKKKKLSVHCSTQKGKKNGGSLNPTAFPAVPAATPNLFHGGASSSKPQVGMDLLGHVDLGGHAPQPSLKPPAFRDACKPESSGQDGLSKVAGLSTFPTSLCTGTTSASPPRLYEKAYERTSPPKLYEQAFNETSPPKLYEKAYEEFVSAGFGAVAGVAYKRPHADKEDLSAGWEKKHKVSKKLKPGHSGCGKSGVEATTRVPASCGSSSSSSTSSIASSESAASSVRSPPSAKRNGRFHVLSEASPSSLGAHSNTDVPQALQGSIEPGGSMSLIPSLLSQQNPSSLPLLPLGATAAFPSTFTASSTIKACSPPRASFGSVSTHPCGNPLVPGPGLAPHGGLMGGLEEDKSDKGERLHKGNSPSLSSFMNLGDGSPGGSQGVRSEGRVTQTASGTPQPLTIGQASHSCSGGTLGMQPEVLQPTPYSIEQLLERQLNEGQKFLLEHGATGDVVGCLQNLSQLQAENRRLEEQIRALTARRDRLLLMSTQLSLPFPPYSHDQPHRSKSPWTNSFQSDSTLSLSTPEQSACSQGASTPLSVPSSSPMTPSFAPPIHSASGVGAPPSSTTSWQSQGSLTAGVAAVTLAGRCSGPQSTVAVPPSLNALPAAGRILASLPANQIAINGLVSALNGVIQPPGPGQNANVLPSPSTANPTITLSLPTSLNSSMPGVALLPDQQHPILLHQQPLQQLLSGQPFSQDSQHQALMYQLVQQQQQQHHQTSMAVPVGHDPTFQVASPSQQPLHAASSQVWPMCRPHPKGKRDKGNACGGDGS